MTIDKALLRQAWPAGFVPMRGVRTVDGWTVLDMEPATESSVGGIVFVAPRLGKGWPVNALALAGVHEGHLLIEPAKCDPEDQALQLALHLAYENGDLLPNVDPEDTATWACLLRDLAEAAGMYPSAANLIWYQYWGSWWLASRIFGGLGTKDVQRLVTTDTNDPALALVLARIQLRKTEAA